ncbi:MAG: hypothetical protein AABY07_08910, partial [Nanoarchaeota archaeon]
GVAGLVGAGGMAVAKQPRVFYVDPQGVTIASRTGVPSIGAFAGGTVAVIKPITDPSRLLPSPDMSIFEKKIPILVRYLEKEEISNYISKGYFQHPDPTKELFFTIPEAKIRTNKEGWYYLYVEVKGPSLVHDELALYGDIRKQIFFLQTSSVRDFPIVIEKVRPRIDLVTKIEIPGTGSGYEVRFPPGTKIPVHRIWDYESEQYYEMY